MAKNPITTVKQTNEGLYVTWDDSPGSKNAALVSYGQAIQSIQSLPTRASASLDYRSYRNIEPNLSVRSSYSRDAYEQFRPGETLGGTPREVMQQCQAAYEKVGVIRNIMDLMADFTIQGIHLVHPNKKIQQVYRKWWNKVNGKERSERFVSILYRLGTVIVKKDKAKVPIKVRKELAKGSLVGEPEPREILPKTTKYEIPWEYTFINPMNIDILEGDAASFLGQYNYAMRISPNLLAKLQNSKVVLPPFIQKAIRSNTGIIELPMDKIVTFFYKKDDWQVWPRPMLEAILGDIQLLEKMKLADLAALDGVISNVRIWKLGSLDHKIIPTPAVIAKLSQALTNVGNGNTADLIWGPELSFEQHIPEVNKILGSEKYVSVMTAIYEGLGVPSTLTAKSEKSGFSNNFIGLKILIERLEYGRNVLVKFWETELREFQLAMGYKSPARIKFGRNTLSDDVAEKALIIQLADRNLISWDTVQEIFGQDVEIESARMRYNAKDERKGNLPRKAGPYMDPRFPEKNTQRLKELALQSGAYGPSEVGLELEPRKPGEKSASEINNQKGLTDQKKNGGQPNQGRPINSKDSEKRKRKAPTIRTSAEEIEATKVMLWASVAQEQIDIAVNPVYLEYVGKSNLRQLTKTEDKRLDDLKFAILNSMLPYEKLVTEHILGKLNNPLDINKGVINIYEGCLKQYPQEELTAQNKKLLKALSYSIYHSNKETNG